MDELDALSADWAVQELSERVEGQLVSLVGSRWYLRQVRGGRGGENDLNDEIQAGCALVSALGKPRAPEPHPHTEPIDAQESSTRGKHPYKLLFDK